MNKPLLSVGTLLNKLPLEDQFYIAKEAGFDGIDYVLSLNDLFQVNKNVHALSEKFEIPIKGVHIPLLLIPYCPEFFFTKLYSAILKFPKCEIFNVHLSSFVTPIARNGKTIHKFLNIFNNKKITIAFESNPKTKIFQFYPKVTAEPELFADFCVKNNLSINLDTSHLGTFNYDLNKFYSLYKNNVKLIHFSDFDGETQHLPFGSGNLLLTELFKIMKKTNYKGHSIFEIFKFPKYTTQKERLREMKKSVDLFINETR